MATFLDLGFASSFSIVFIFLLVFVIIYAVLEFSKPFGKDKQGLHAIMGIAIAVLIVIYRPAVLMINFITPWFVVLFLFGFFIIFAIKMFGVSDADTVALIKQPNVWAWIVIFSIAIIIAGFSTVFGQILLEEGQGLEEQDLDAVDIQDAIDEERGSTASASFGNNVLNTVIHPRVLGFVAIMFIGMFAIIFLTKAA